MVSADIKCSVFTDGLFDQISVLLEKRTWERIPLRSARRDPALPGRKKGTVSVEKPAELCCDPVGIMAEYVSKIEKELGERL